MKLLKDTLQKNTYNITVEHYDIDVYNLYASYNIKIIETITGEKFNIIKIILNVNECFSINVKDGFTTGSVDTNLYFLYLDYIKNKIYFNNLDEANENLYYINQYEYYIKNIINNDVNKRLKSECYGELNNEEEIKRVWKQKLTIKYLS